MINLLPPDDRKQLAAARTNSLLIRYVFLLGVFFVILLLEIAFTYVLLDNDQVRYQATIDENNTKNVAYLPVKRNEEQFRSNLATAKVILSQQIPYTDIIIKIAQALPTGVTIDHLTLDPTTFGQETQVSVKAASYGELIATKTKLQNSNVVSDVQFQDITAGTGTEQYKATLKLKFNKELLVQ